MYGVVVVGNFVGSVHTAAVYCCIRRTEAPKLDKECLCYGESEDVSF